MEARDLKVMLSQAEAAAKNAAHLMLKANTQVTKKGRIDLVTDADMAVNQFLCSSLSAIDNSIDIIAEEGVEPHLRKPRAKLCWVIDPIDGTTNFVHGMMHSAISIALYDRQKQESIIGVVLNPFRNECFTAIKNGGALLNNLPIQVSENVLLIDSVICTGFSYDIKTNPDNNLEEFKTIMAEAQGMRRLGAASLDLAYVAAGRFDGYFEKGLKFWDYAAGMLLVSESGGQNSCYDGLPVTDKSGHIVATNKIIHSTLLAAIQQARSNAGFGIVPK